MWQQKTFFTCSKNLFKKFFIVIKYFQQNIFLTSLLNKTSFQTPKFSLPSEQTTCDWGGVGKDWSNEGRT